MLERIGRYRLKRRIGAGGQATVYLGHDTVLDSRVAVKVMHQVATSNEEYVEALRAEASTARILSHSNIAPIYDFTVEDDYACIVMEYFPNSVDKELVNSGPIPHSRAIEIIVAVCQETFPKSTHAVSVSKVTNWLAIAKSFPPAV